MRERPCKSQILSPRVRNRSISTPQSGRSFSYLADLESRFLDCHMGRPQDVAGEHAA